MTLRLLHGLGYYKDSFIHIHANRDAHVPAFVKVISEGYILFLGIEFLGIEIPGIEFLGHKVFILSTLVERAKLFSKGNE